MTRFTSREIDNAKRRISLPEYRRAIAEIAEVVSNVLSGSDRVELRPAAGAEVCGRAAFASGTGPLLGYWIETGVLDADRQAAEVLLRHLRHMRRRATLFESDVSALLNSLGDGVQLTALKGFHTARNFFPEPGCRPATDVDILADPDNCAVVEAAIRSLGYVPGPRTDGAYRGDWTHPDTLTGPSSLDFTHVENPRGFDLHRSLSRTMVAGTTAVMNFPRGSLRKWNFDPRMRVLAQPYLTAFLAVHACERIRETQLIRIVELCLVARGDAADPAELEEVLRKHSLAEFALPALSLASALTPDQIDPDLIGRLREGATRRMVRVLDSITPGTVQRGGASSLDELLLYARGVWPSIRATLFAVFPVRRLRNVGRLPRITLRRIRSILRGDFSARVRNPSDP